MMTEEQKQARIESITFRLKTLDLLEEDGMHFDVVERDSYRIALAALTQPASPAMKLPDGWVAVPREATSEMIESGWTYSVLEKNATAKGTWACMVAAAPTVPHTAPIEPICATGGADWVKVSERMPPGKTGVLVATEMGRPGDWRMKWATFVPGHPDADDGWLIPGASWTPTHWMPLPAAPEA